jgi:Tfp pilus assembly protein PilN
MINLLPPEEKKKLLLEKKKKIVTIFWLLILFFIFCSILFLFLAKIYLRSELKSEKAVLEMANKGVEQSEIQDVRQRVKLANLNFKKLNSFYHQKIYFSDILENISKIIPQEIFLKGISINSSVNKKKKLITEISISGFSPTREILFNFREKLQNDNYFKEVYFSPSNWIKSTDINFFITFKAK